MLGTSGTVQPEVASARRETVIEARNLRCTYGSHVAVRDIDIEVRRGELFALLGTNGAGKTTTIEALQGHRPPTSGRIRVLGHVPHRKRRSLARRVGVVFQETATPEDLTPSETVSLWLRLNSEDASPSRVANALEQVDLLHRTQVRNRKLSGGERRRLDLAIALSTDPELLFLDEPTAGLDPESRHRTWSVIRDRLRGGVTVLLTTHYLEEAESLADRLAIMHEGRIAVAGELSELLRGRSSRIEALTSVGLAPSSLPRFTGKVTLVSHAAGNRLTISTESLQSDLTALLNWASQRRVRLRQLRAVEPALSEVFHEVSQGMTAVNGAGR